MDYKTTTYKMMKIEFCKEFVKSGYFTNADCEKSDEKFIADHTGFVAWLFKNKQQATKFFQSDCGGVMADDENGHCLLEFDSDDNEYLNWNIAYFQRQKAICNGAVVPFEISVVSGLRSDKITWLVNKEIQQQVFDWLMKFFTDHVE